MDIERDTSLLPPPPILRPIMQQIQGTLLQMVYYSHF